MHLLFWISLIPLVTSFLGERPFWWPATLCYSLVFMLVALSFTLIRKYIIIHDLLHHNDKKHAHAARAKKNMFAALIYGLAAPLSFINLWLSFGIFVWVPAYYFFHQIKHTN
ncbi:MAG: hypothetical protein LPK49_05670 [Bacteroidota bacterium]|nr:hypothetical protein [Bacteroidota bacterium]